MISTDTTWYNGNPKALRATLDTLEQALCVVRAIDASYLREYHQCPESAQMTAVDAIVGQAAATQSALTARRKESLLRSMVDSFCAMVVSIPSIDVKTVAGTYDQRQAAELLGAFDDAVLKDNDMHALAWQCVVDTCLARVGGVLVEVDGAGRIRVQRVLPHHILYNPMDGVEPQNLHIRTPVSLSSVIAAHPDQATDLRREAKAYQPDPLFLGIDGYTPEVAGDLVLLDRAWHLPDPGKPESGRFVQTVGDIVLGKTPEKGDEWGHPWFPFVPLRFDYSYANFGGKPAADTIEGYQADLDEYGDTVREGYRKGCKVRVLLSKESGVDKKQLNDVNGQVIDHNPGHPPVFDRGVGLPPEYLQREATIIQRAHEFLGLNYNTARGMKADGISSAKGQREVIQLAQNRQVLRMQTIQNWVVKIAETVNRTADAAFDRKKGTGDFTVKAPSGRYLRRLKWSELNFDDELVSLSCDAINALSRHPAARVEEVLELVQGKLLTEKQGLKAIANKDLQYARDEAFALEDYAQRMVELALSGDFRTPDPYAGPEGLKLVVERGQTRYLAESVEKLPSEHLHLLRDLIEAAKAVLAEVEPAAPPPAPPLEPAMPGAPDMAVLGAGLPALPPAAGPPVPGQGLSI